MNYPTPRVHHSRLRAFTLIELLTVIAIIGILAAIIIPTVGKVRESARMSQGLSNIRQVTMTLIVHAEENGGKLLDFEIARPGGGTVLWGSYLSKSISRGNVYEEAPRNSDIFYDPMLRLPEASWGPGGHFGFLAAFTQAVRGGPLSNSAYQARRFQMLSAHKQPSQQIYVADAGVNPEGWPAGNLFAVDNNWWTWAGVWGGTPSEAQGNEPIIPGNSEPGNIRWTNGKAKFGFMDGHVEMRSQERVLRRNINPMFQGQ